MTMLVSVYSLLTFIGLSFIAGSSCGYVFGLIDSRTFPYKRKPRAAKPVATQQPSGKPMMLDYDVKPHGDAGDWEWFVFDPRDGDESRNFAGGIAESEATAIQRARASMAYFHAVANPYGSPYEAIKA